MAERIEVRRAWEATEADKEMGIDKGDRIYELSTGEKVIHKRLPFLPPDLPDDAVELIPAGEPIADRALAIEEAIERFERGQKMTFTKRRDDRPN